MKKILLLVAICVSLNAIAQKASNKLTFKKGQKLEMVTVANTLMTMDMMGQEMETKVAATITRHFDIEDVSNGSTVIEHKMKRMQMNTEAPMVGAQSFDSENEKDMKGEGGKAMEKALKNKYTMTLDVGGKITMVKADDNNPNKADSKNAGEDMMSGVMSQIADGMELPKMGDASEFSILPRSDMNKGETWTDTTGGNKTVYTLADITAGEIVINYTENASTERTQEANGMELKISTKDVTTGKITLDSSTGVLKSKTGDTVSDGTMEMMGQSIPIKTKVTKTITVKAI